MLESRAFLGANAANRLAQTPSKSPPSSPSISSFATAALSVTLDFVAHRKMGPSLRISVGSTSTAPWLLGQHFVGDSNVWVLQDR